MKPLPAEGSPASRRPTISDLTPLASMLPTATDSVSSSNRRAQAISFPQRIYPWMLATSTLVAGVFCFLYISKPVLNTLEPVTPSATHNLTQPGAPAAAASLPAAAKAAKLIPAGDHLPGDAPDAKPSALATRHLTDAAPLSEGGTPFEDTNLVVQHILYAETPDEKIARLRIDVPVLYRSGNLRWTPEQAAQARDLGVRLADYQDRVRNLRNEGVALLEQWHSLMAQSIPSSVLRADSPSLPANQGGASSQGRPPALNSAESIRVQPSNPR